MSSMSFLSPIHPSTISSTSAFQPKTIHHPHHSAMSIHASPAFALANKTFTSSLDDFGLRRPASGPVDHEARIAAADAFLNTIDTSNRTPKESSGSRRHIFDVDFPTTAPLEPASGPNSMSLGTRRRGPRRRANATSQPPPEVIAVSVLTVWREWRS